MEIKAENTQAIIINLVNEGHTSRAEYIRLMQARLDEAEKVGRSLLSVLNVVPEDLKRLGELERENAVMKEAFAQLKDYFDLGSLLFSVSGRWKFAADIIEKMAPIREPGHKHLMERVFAEATNYLRPSATQQMKHGENCNCSQKTWGDESRCDCGLSDLRVAVDKLLPEGFASQEWKTLVAEAGKSDHA